MPETATTTRTTRNTSGELSWERETNRIGYEALIERIVHDAIAANLTKGEMNSVNKKLSSLEEPEFTWTVLYHDTKQKSVRKDDTSRTDQDSEDQQHFSCEIERLGDCVIDVGCAKQEVISSSALQSECYGFNTGGACTVHTNYLDRDRIKRCMTTMRKLTAGFGLENSCLWFRTLV